MSPHSESHRARPPSAQVSGLRKMVEPDEPKIKVIKRASTKGSLSGGGGERTAGYFSSVPSKTLLMRRGVFYAEFCACMT